MAPSDPPVQLQAAPAAGLLRHKLARWLDSSSSDLSPCVAAPATRGTDAVRHLKRPQRGFPQGSLSFRKHRRRESARDTPPALPRKR